MLNTRPDGLSTDSLDGFILVFENPVCVYRFSPDINVYRIQDRRFFDVATYYEVKKFMSIFNVCFEEALRSKRPVITIPYNPVLAKVVGVVLDKYFSGVPEGWRAVSFFHNDGDTAKITLPGGESPLDQKFTVIKTMLDYPYIKKIEIPYNGVITPGLLNALFQ